LYVFYIKDIDYTECQLAFGKCSLYKVLNAISDEQQHDILHVCQYLFNKNKAKIDNLWFNY